MCRCIIANAKHANLEIVIIIFYKKGLAILKSSSIVDCKSIENIRITILFLDEI